MGNVFAFFGAVLFSWRQDAAIPQAEPKTEVRFCETSYPYQHKRLCIAQPFVLVRVTGLEPAHQRYQILNLARLPIPPYPRQDGAWYGGIASAHTNELLLLYYASVALSSQFSKVRLLFLGFLAFFLLFSIEMCRESFRTY